MKYNSRCWLYRSTFIQIRKTSCAVAYNRIQSTICGHASELSPSVTIIAGQWPWRPPPRLCEAPRTVLSLEVASIIHWRCACSSDGCSSDCLGKNISLQHQERQSMHLESLRFFSKQIKKTQTALQKKGWADFPLPFTAATLLYPTIFSLNVKKKQY